MLRMLASRIRALASRYKKGLLRKSVIASQRARWRGNPFPF